MRFTDIYINFDAKYESHQKLVKNTFYGHFEGFYGPSYGGLGAPFFEISLIL